MGTDAELARFELDLGRGASEVEPGQPHVKALLRNILAHAPDFIAIIRPDGRILFLNRVRAGASLESSVGTSVYDYVSSTEAARYRTCLERVIATGEAGVVETEMRFSNGQLAFFENRLSPIREGDRIVALTVIATDITLAKQASLALQESNAKLRMAVDATGIGLWSWEVSSDVVHWEDGMRSIFGFAPGATPAGRDGFLRTVHPEDRQRVAEVIGRGLATGRWEDEYRIVRADGAVRWVIAKGTVLNDAGGPPERVVGAVIDVTDRRRQEEQLRQTQKLEAVGQLTAGIAHNFNNMLMGVLPNIELALERAAPDVAPLLCDAAQAAARAADLVKKLTTAAGRRQPSKRSVESVPDLVDRTVQMCVKTFDRRIAFRTSYDPSCRARVDPSDLEQAILNVLINARDALDNEATAPTITVDVSVVPARSPELPAPYDAQGDSVRIHIKDNGHGMSEETLARIYEPFFTTKDVGRGTGLGLATTRAILRECGGWVDCQSSLGGGTTFSFYLPAEAGADASAGTGGGAETLVGGTELVLVIDDEPAIREVVALMLGEAGYSTLTAYSGPAAMALLADPQAAAKVDVVLLDVSMPGMPRRELRNRLRDLVPRAPVIYFTGYGFDAAESSDDVVLEKPASRGQLLEAIRGALDGRAPTEAASNPAARAPAI